MSKAINVKVSRVRIIEELKSKVEEMHNLQTNFNFAHDVYITDLANWKKELAQLAVLHKEAILSENVSINEAGSWRVPDGFVGVELNFHLPVSVANVPAPQPPKNPFHAQGYGRNHIGGYEERVGEIQNAIRLLSMSDEEVVSTSTYQSVSRYL